MGGVLELEKLSETEAIAEAIVPYFPDDTKKSKYLSYRVTGFTMREALKLADVSETSIRGWRRTDPEFAKIDKAGLNELKEKLGAKYLSLQFSRNFNLVLQKDFKVLVKSLNEKELSKDDFQYLLKIRQFYTPQQLAIIQQIVGEAPEATGFDFTKFILEIRREREEIIITGNNGNE